MKKIMISMSFLLVVFGCSKSNEEINQEKTYEAQTQNNESGVLIDESIDKLSSVPFQAKGYTTEIRHIAYGGNVSPEDPLKHIVDKSSLTATLESFQYTYDYQDIQNSWLTKKYFLGGIDNAGSSQSSIWFYGGRVKGFELEASLDNMKLDLNAQVDTENVKKMSLQNGVLWEDGESKEFDESKADHQALTNFLDSFRYHESKGNAFFQRGGRILSYEVLNSKIEKENDKTIITFYYEKDNESANAEIDFIINDAFNIIDQVDEHGKNEIDQQFYDSKIVVEIDKDGYLSSYYAEGIWEFKAQNTKIPYIQSFTFTR